MYFLLGLCCCFVKCNSCFFLLGQACHHIESLWVSSQESIVESQFGFSTFHSDASISSLNILATPLGNQSVGESLSCLQGYTMTSKKQVKIMFIQQHKVTRVQLHKMTNPSILKLTRRMLIIHSLLFLKCYKECSKQIGRAHV